MNDRIVATLGRRFGEKSRLNLRGVHPDLILVLSRALMYSPHDFAVTEGMRGIERQRELVRKGSSLTYDSKHLVQSDGFAHAVDVMAVGDLNSDGRRDHQDKSITWDRVIYDGIARGMQAAADELGIRIRWGGDFKTHNGHSFYDGPHFELF